MAHVLKENTYSQYNANTTRDENPTNTLSAGSSVERIDSLNRGPGPEEDFFEKVNPLDAHQQQ